MNERALASLMDDLGRALDRLGEALQRPPDDAIVIDATIQRFEFTFELFWKTLRRFLAQEGIEALSPRAALRQGYRIGWLDDEAAWLRMLDDRNLTSHTYREQLALEIYARIADHAQALRSAFAALRARRAADDAGAGTAKGGQEP